MTDRNDPDEPDDPTDPDDEPESDPDPRGVVCCYYAPPECGKEHEWLLEMLDEARKWIGCQNYGMAGVSVGLMRSVLEDLAQKGEA